MLKNQSWARLVAVPENHGALVAVQHLLDCLRANKPQHAANPLYLHGFPGTGKSHLVSAAVQELIRARSDTTVQHLYASDFREPVPSPRKSSVLNEAGAVQVPAALGEEACRCDLFILEDLQHLPFAAIERLVQIIDHRLSRNRAMVFTALIGPGHLMHRGNSYPARLTSRLAGGLVVALEPLQAPSRLLFLQEMAQRRQLGVTREILHWLADHLTGGGRQLEGAISQLQTLTKVSRRPLDLKTISAHFSTQVNSGLPSLDKIAARVSYHFRVESRHLQSRHRHHNALLPRQVSMYLARQLTKLSLEQIGAYFGGRDHTTVLHACRKISETIASDAVFSGAVRQIHAELA